MPVREILQVGVPGETRGPPVVPDNEYKAGATSFSLVAPILQPIKNGTI